MSEPVRPQLREVGQDNVLPHDVVLVFLRLHDAQDNVDSVRSGVEQFLAVLEAAPIERTTEQPLVHAVEKRRVGRTLPHGALRELLGAGDREKHLVATMPVREERDEVLASGFVDRPAEQVAVHAVEKLRVSSLSRTCTTTEQTRTANRIERHPQRIAMDFASIAACDDAVGRMLLTHRRPVAGCLDRHALRRRRADLRVAQRWSVLLMIDLGPAAARVAGLLAATRDDQLDGATPCPDTTVGDLIDHIRILTLAFTAKAEKREDGPPPAPSAANLEAGWRERITRDLDQLVAAWRNSSAWEGTTTAGGIDLPAEVAGLVVLDELVVHGWDLAIATGQSYDPGADDLNASIGFVSSFDAPRDGSLFGPIVPVSADASLLDRLLCLTGRDPAWITSP